MFIYISFKQVEMESIGSNFVKESVGSDCEKESIGSDCDQESIGSGFTKETADDYHKESIGSNCEDDYDSRMWKKKTVYEDDRDIALILSIFHAEGIDDPMMSPITYRTYKVEFWVEIGTLCMTPEVYGLPNPEWNKKFRILLENPMDCRFLYVEVIRTCSKIDPGTSTGEVLVGRVRLPLPELSTKIEGSFELVRPEGPGCRVQGHIRLAMELRKVRKA
ncbi:uncharacterized protein LOC8262752 [Ricinus communis]|uniref:uncharacterized protein LOC8262752 n=1 Tax=Ricinus communis TaxID=3988 RepID=UPI00201B089A|nr:uncharacterized protein LOC8262752 [Ricinus communis]